ncbi:hypothetical protein [Lentzea sp. HUAS12]|uniref:hypothetical protein n=1 Tax=Lentzea sp. HUAS12 TaxID=2951806 RepID=UPI0020A0DF1A|nr:hypothetical protein [Lentzea sp. HUAS12]USX55902.1 hypothetical protein ND450_17930 [Lentzea sp. HUAS12]
MIRRNIFRRLVVPLVAGALALAAWGTASAAVDQTASTANRNVSRVPAFLAQDDHLSDGCFGTTLPIVCDVSEPIVNQKEFTYNFSFLPGDHVLVSGGGCVQTGGHGATWKRYVDPASDNGLYHGLITIPGATGTLDRLLDVVGRPLVVPGRGPVKLVLGYQDDNYSDNGYYSHDNGTGDQCKNSVNAFVHIVVT